jgi:hypothetical protein
MAVPLSICSEEEQRAVVCFLWADDVKGVEIHRHSSAQHGDNVLPRQNVYEWIKMFKNGRTDIVALCSGHPSTSTSDEKQARATILDDRTITIRNVATQLDISHGSAHAVMHNIPDTTRFVQGG